MAGSPDPPNAAAAAAANGSDRDAAISAEGNISSAVENERAESNATTIADTTSVTSVDSALNNGGPSLPPRVAAVGAPATGEPSVALASPNATSAILPPPRKFLCNAPRPEQWDTCGDSVLERLGSSKNAFAVLSNAIAAIRSLHSIQTKVGPGRKSNAVHALLFYEYLKDRAQQEGGHSHHPRSSSRTSSNNGGGGAGGREADDDNGSDDDDGSIQDSNEPTALAENGSDHQQDGAVNIEENSMVLLSDEEFVRVHRTICEVCECGPSSLSPDDDIVDVGAGPLLLCSTCECAFHVPCSRPALEGGPPPENERWRCSYCVLATEPKHTKPRRVAAAAVRLMARLRNQHRRKGRKNADGMGPVESNSQSEVILRRGRRVATTIASLSTPQRPERTPAAPSASGVDADDLGAKSSHTSSISAATGSDVDEEDPGALASAGSGSPRRRSLELYRITNSWSPQEPPTTTDGGESPRGKRVRKQPVMYDPQDVPARKWKSDEVPVPRPGSSSGGSSASGPSSDEDGSDSPPRSGTNSAGDTDGEDAADEMDADAATGARRGRGGAVWCNFCFDNPEIKVCCFCACRVCFGKKSSSKLLICDICNDEYHTYCLDPPLDRVPEEEKWFCPTCSEANAKRAARASSRLRIPTEKAADEASTPRRMSTRIPATKKESDASVSIASINRGSDSGASCKPRGRPRKSPPPDPTTSSAGKKRGRPPRSPPVEPARKRGRPPKSKAQTSPGRGASKSPSSPGRGASKSPSNSAKVEIKSSAVDASTADMQVDTSDYDHSIPSTPEGGQAQLTISRSGRTVKRSSFHDEKEEGDQHLRSGRQLVEPPRIASISSELTLELPPTGAVSTEPVSAMAPDVAPTSDATTFEGPPDVPSQADSTTPVPAADSTEPIDTLAASVGTAGAPNSFQEDPESSFMDQDGPKDPRAPRRKPGARECMQMSRRFGAQVIPEQNMEILIDYCNRGKCEHLIRMRERLDEHCRFLEAQLAGLEVLAREQSAGSQSQADRIEK